jgi:hypothetical protein
MAELESPILHFTRDGSIVACLGGKAEMFSSCELCSIQNIVLSLERRVCHMRQVSIAMVLV